jgi:hypothetical protein
MLWFISIGRANKKICFDSWYASVENLRLIYSLGWDFLTRLKESRKIRVDGCSLQAVSKAVLWGGNGTLCWLKDFGEIKAFCIRAPDGTAEYWTCGRNE